MRWVYLEVHDLARQWTFKLGYAVALLSVQVTHLLVSLYSISVMHGLTLVCLHIGGLHVQIAVYSSRNRHPQLLRPRIDSVYGRS